MEGFILVYIYKAFSNDKHNIPALKKEDLLIPPVMINRLAWSRGHFETIEHRPLTEEDVWRVHCFHDVVRKYPLYLDEFGNKLPEKVEPCGEYLLYGPGYINKAVSAALGLPLIEEEYE